jgi:antitoxin HicB
MFSLLSQNALPSLLRICEHDGHVGSENCLYHLARNAAAQAYPFAFPLTIGYNKNALSQEPARRASNATASTNQIRRNTVAARTIYKLPLLFEPQTEGGYTVTCPILPELITEGDTVAEALDNVADALRAIVEAYEDLGRPLPSVLRQAAFDQQTPFWIETAVGL